MKAEKVCTESIEAARARLRPILMTSLTTTIGMFIAFRFLGDGGRVLQPLGIAISGGLWISMLFTLYFVPSLQVAYIEISQEEVVCEGDFSRKLGELFYRGDPMSFGTEKTLFHFSLFSPVSS